MIGNIEREEKREHKDCMIGLCELSSGSVRLEVLSERCSLHKCKQSRVQGIGIIEISCQSPKTIRGQ